MSSAVTTVHQYRVYCQTEGAYVYTWGSTAPTTCPHNTGHTIDTNSISIVDTVSNTSTTVSNLLKTPFQELFVSEKTPVMELKSMYGKSALRDIYNTTGTGAITNSIGDGEYRLRVTGANSYAKIQSTERGRYIAGYGAEMGIGFRMPTAPTGNIVYRWGLYDDTNGFFFIRDAQGFGVVIRRNSVETRVNQSAFNHDKVDGTGPSGVNMLFTNGHIYQIVFSWYGYGVVKFQVATKNPSTMEQETIVLHTHFTNGQTSVRNPNLPIQAEIESGDGDVSDVSIYLTGRQYAIIGKYLPMTRVNSCYQINYPVTSTTQFQHIMTVRRKNGYAANAIKIDSLDYMTTAYMLLQIRVNTTVTGGTYTNIPDQVADETVLECNTSASSVADGIVIWSGFSTTDRVGLQQVTEIMYTLPEYQTLSLMAKGINTNNGQITALLRWTEEW